MNSGLITVFSHCGSVTIRKRKGFENAAAQKQPTFSLDHADPEPANVITLNKPTLTEICFTERKLLKKTP